MTFRFKNRCPIPGCFEQRYVTKGGAQKAWCAKHLRERRNAYARKRRLREGMTRHPNRRPVTILVADYSHARVIRMVGYEVGISPMPGTDKDLQRLFSQEAAGGTLVVEQIAGERTLT